ncbi:WG repeat-containing protein, partial [candidate division WOR-3 bacterium]|nr:WG repeat-containing protein [candidate division WOR-3 bacterium]
MLLLPLLLVTCWRDYLMPPARVRLPQYQAEGLYSEGLCVISERQDLRRGYMDMEGRVVIPPKYFAAGRFSGGLAAVEESPWDGYGYIDRQGTVVIPPRFDAALAFAGELAPVRVGGRWGFINRQGKEVIPPQFDMAFAFAGGRARVAVDGFAGFIDETGKVVVEPKYFRAEDYHEGLAMVCDGRHCGFIDSAGRQVVPLEYDDAGSFADGLAPVRKSALWGYIDREGRVAIPPKFDRAAPFSEGLARVARVKDWSYDRRFGGYSGRREFFGFIDREGREVIKTVILETEPFSEGRTRVTVPARGFTTDATDVRLTDARGKFLPGRFQTASAFQEGRAVVTMNTGTTMKSYVIDREGRPIIELSGSYPGNTDESARQHVRVRYGYIDPAGQTVLEHVWTEAQPFSEGLAFVESAFKRGHRTRGYIDRTGRLVLPLPDTMTMPLPFTDGLALVAGSGTSPSRYGYFDRAGRMRIDFRYANAAPFRDGLAAVKFSDGLSAYDWGYIDTTGTVAVAPRFKDAGSFANGLAYVETVRNGNQIVPAVIDRNGNTVVDKPFIMEWSNALFGVPSLEQFRRRRQMVFDDLLIPRYDGGERGYVDAANRLVIPGAVFQTLGVFREGRAAISIGGRFGYIDTAGELVIEPQFAAAGPFHEGCAIVRDDAGRTGYVRLDGTWAIEPLWLEEACPFSAGRARVRL